MVTDVSEHVFAGTATPEDVAAMRAAFDQGHRMTDLMRVALLRYAKERAKARRTPEDTTDAAAGVLRARLDESCGTCHRDGDKPFLNSPQLSKDLLFQALERVSFNEMPPDTPLVGKPREELIGSLLSTLFEDPAARAKAAAYFKTSFGPARIHEPDVARRLVHSRAGTPPGNGGQQWRQFLQYYEEPPHLIYSRPFAAGIVFEAVKECRAAGGSPEKIAACVDNATLLHGIMSGASE
jgi:hypothetical protein